MTSAQISTKRFVRFSTVLAAMLSVVLENVASDIVKNFIKMVSNSEIINLVVYPRKDNLK